MARAKFAPQQGLVLFAKNKKRVSTFYQETLAIKPTFVVRSLEDVRNAAARTGGYLKPASEVWRFRGCVVLDGWDPEGNQVQFKQRGTDYS